MQIASATLAIPEDGSPVLLAGLAYQGEWKVEFTSIQLDRDQRENADQVQQVWTLNADSSRPIVQKVIVEIDVLDGSGKKVKSVKKFVVVKASKKNQEVPVKMKIKSADWSRGEKIRIKTTFTVL